MKNTFLNTVKGSLIISCQALPNEPLHSSFIMSRMALAAKEAGAAGIRANSVVDIQAIQDEVDLPLIGLSKVDYPDSPVLHHANNQRDASRCCYGLCRSCLRCHGSAAS